MLSCGVICYNEVTMEENKKEELITFEKRQKSYHELTFTDNFLFCKIMEKNPAL